MKKWLIGALSLSLLLTGTTPVLGETSSQLTSFADTQGYWAEKTIQTAATIDLFEGFPDGGFHPNELITRAQFMTALSRAMGDENQETARLPFEDVDKQDWFYPYVSHLWYEGVIQEGDYQTHLYPNEPIPRQEMARMAARVADRYGEMQEKGKTFPDVPTSHPYFQDISKAAGYGILKGYPDETFGSEKKATRAEATAVLLRTLSVNKPKSPYVAEKFTGAWEPARIAGMFIDAGWEEAFSQKGETIDLSDLQSFASKEAIEQYRAYLKMARSMEQIDTRGVSVWMGEFNPKYINRDIALVSWYLGITQKLDSMWYRQTTDPFTIVLKRGENRNWKVVDFPVVIPPEGQKDWPLPRLQEPLLSRKLSFKYTDESGTYYAFQYAGKYNSPQQEDAVPVLREVFEVASPGKVEFLRIMGVPAQDTSNAQLVKTLEEKDPSPQKQGIHHLFYIKAGTMVGFSNKPAEELVESLWVLFNAFGGGSVVMSIDGIPWGMMSDDPFWREVQGMKREEVVTKRQELGKRLEEVLDKYKDKYKNEGEERK